MPVGQLGVKLVLRDHGQKVPHSRRVGGETCELEVRICIGGSKLESLDNIQHGQCLHALALRTGVFEHAAVANGGHVHYFILDFHGVNGQIEVQAIPKPATCAQLKTLCRLWLDVVKAAQVDADAAQVLRS